MYGAVRLGATQNERIPFVHPFRLLLKLRLRFSLESHQRQSSDGRLIRGGPAAIGVLVGLQPGQPAIYRALNFVAEGNIPDRYALSDVPFASMNCVSAQQTQQNDK